MLLSAVEAKKVRRENREQLFDLVLEKINNDIKESASAGSNCSFFFYNSYDSDIVEKLKEELLKSGYILEEIRECPEGFHHRCGGVQIFWD